MRTEAAARGCGRRKAGGIYAVTRVARPGEPARPVEDFLVCPPFLPGRDVPTQGMTPIAVKGRDGQEIVHALDYVGAEGYPTVPHFVREAAYIGVSRRIPKTFDFSVLTPGRSLLVTVHPRAFVWDVAALDVNRWPMCPRNLDHHAHTDPHRAMCVKLLWHAVPGGTLVTDTMTEQQMAIVRDYDPDWRRAATHKLACGATLLAHRPPEGWTWDGMDSSAAVFARWPIHELHVIKSPDGAHEEAMEIAAGSGYTTLLADA